MCYFELLISICGLEFFSNFFFFPILEGLTRLAGPILLPLPRVPSRADSGPPFVKERVNNYSTPQFFALSLLHLIRLIAFSCPLGEVFTMIVCNILNPVA